MHASVIDKVVPIECLTLFGPCLPPSCKVGWPPDTSKARLVLPNRISCPLLAWMISRLAGIMTTEHIRDACDRSRAVSDRSQMDSLQQVLLRTLDIIF